MTDRELLALAREAGENAYAPYSHFTVGAALLGEDGRVFTGCNVECASYPAGVCAERAALSAAVAAGVRKFAAIAVAGRPHGADYGVCMPCGICRQALCEFSPGMRVVTGGPDGVFKLEELLPHGFRL